MRKKAYILVFDGLADWEPARALCEINKSEKFDVVAVGFTGKQVITMGGLYLVPDTTIDAVDPIEAAIFIMPGGDMWEQRLEESITILLRRLHDAGTILAAICAATLEIARADLTRGCRHTSNSKNYLREMVPGYSDEEFYVDDLAVTDNKIITASGLGSVEFGREIIRELNIYNDADTKIWFDMFRHGVLPASEAIEQGFAPGAS